MPSLDTSARTSRSKLHWQIAFAAYAVALTIATHWPRLQLPPDTPASDKTIHVVAFAIGTLLLWNTNWFASVWFVGIIALFWAALDEATQSIPGIHRHATIVDFGANAIGVLIALAVIMLARLVSTAAKPQA